jgi:hypothetical protein
VFRWKSRGVTLTGIMNCALSMTARRHRLPVLQTSRRDRGVMSITIVCNHVFDSRYRNLPGISDL